MNPLFLRFMIRNYLKLSILSLIGIVFLLPFLSYAGTIATQPVDDTYMQSINFQGTPCTSDYFSSYASYAWNPSGFSSCNGVPASTSFLATTSTSFSGTYLTSASAEIRDDRTNSDGTPWTSNYNVFVSLYSDDTCNTSLGINETFAEASPIVGTELLTINTTNGTYPSGLPLSGVQCISVDYSSGNSTGGSATIAAAAGAWGDGSEVYYDLEGDGTPPIPPIPPPATDFSTQIYTVVPTSGSVIPTSSTTTIGATGYVNPSDFTTGMALTIKYNTNVGLCNSSLPFLPCTASSITFPITSSGAFDFSTSSPTTATGQYTMQTNIVGAQSANIFGFQINLPFLSSTKTSTSTTFVVDSLSGYDQYQASTTDSIDSFLASSTIDLSSCDSLSSFNFQNCLSTLFLPQGSVLLNIYTVFQNQFLLDFPWGYATRFVQILSETSTSSLPSASVSIWTPYTDGTYGASTTLTIDPTATLAAAASDLNSVDANGTDLNWQGVLEPYVELFLAITILFIIVGDLFGLIHKGGFTKKNKGGLS